MNITLKQLNYVVVAAQHRSIIGAASALNISTSSIMMAIDKFEHEFGIQAFVRQRSKGLVTTAAGERAIARTIRMLDEAEHYVKDMHGSDQALSGEVRVGSFTSISPKYRATGYSQSERILSGGDRSLIRGRYYFHSEKPS